VEHGAATYGKLLKILVVLDVCVAQKAPIANVLFGKAWVCSTGISVAMEMLPGWAIRTLNLLKS
jgi:hypothetical protein